MHKFKKKKNIMYILSIQDYILPFILLSFIICLLLFSSSNLSAAKKGLKLWAYSVVPSVFPFFVATELLSLTELPYLLGKLFGKIMKPLFNIKGEGSFALIMGIISGYPTGAKIATDFRKNNICSKEECERILSFTNNSGPLFIVGTVGISMFGNTMIGFLLLLTHILACLSVGIIFRFWKKSSYTIEENKNSINTKNEIINLANLGEALSSSISKSISTLLLIGGFIVIFSVLISILNVSNIFNIISTFFIPIFDMLNLPIQLISPLLTGFLEITNGIASIAAINIKHISINIILTAFLLGTGGLSVFFQVFSIISKTDISIKPYIIGKFLQGIFAAFYTFALIEIFPIFNLNL